MQMLNNDYLFSDSSLFVLGVFRLVIIVNSGISSQVLTSRCLVK
jgi:hypothetical protein